MYFKQWFAIKFNHKVQLSKNWQMGLYSYVFVVNPLEVILVSFTRCCDVRMSKKTLQDVPGSIRRKWVKPNSAQKTRNRLFHSCICKMMRGLLKSGERTECLPSLVAKKALKFPETQNFAHSQTVILGALWSIAWTVYSRHNISVFLAVQEIF